MLIVEFKQKMALLMVHQQLKAQQWPHLRPEYLVRERPRLKTRMNATHGVLMSKRMMWTNAAKFLVAQGAQSAI
jgi:hypothetical protein